MVNIRLTRFLRRHCRAAAIWAAIPLAVFNGRTLVGCGCFGHFESACHCGCCSATGNEGIQSEKCDRPCCASHGFSDSDCCCCNRSQSSHHCTATNCDSRPSSGQALQVHHCKSIVLHDVVPVIVAPSSNAGDLHEANFGLADFGMPRSNTQFHIVQVIDFDTGPPPNDLVVTLHRLVI